MKVKYSIERGAEYLCVKLGEVVTAIEQIGVVAIIILTFLNNLFDGRQCVYAWTIGLTLIPALVTGLQTAKISLGPIDNIFNTMVPLHTLGMGWISFTIAGFIIGFIWRAAVSSNKASQ